ncbi:MAG: hypothetical protein WCW33_01205 [Candidatus Babeliales bacterium]|jgi:hypothetical protein
MTLTLTTSLHYGSALTSVNWSPNNYYLTVGGQWPISGHEEIETYSFDGRILTFIPGTKIDYGTNYACSIDWHPNGHCIALGGSPSAPHEEIEIHTADFTSATLSPQALSTSIVLGDHAKGSNYDTHLHLLPGASLNLVGNMLYDNVDAP